MSILTEVIDSLPDGEFEGFHFGEHWTAIVTRVNGIRRCGLASNPLGKMLTHEEIAELEITLKHTCFDEIAQWVTRHDTPLASVGMAAINALLPQLPEIWSEINASELIAQIGRSKRVALVGHFPFVPKLRELVGELNVLELRPCEGDLHASDSPVIIPHADVVAITSMAFINGTMDDLLELCSPEAYVVVLGPSSPLSPLLFNYGIDLVCGSIVDDIESVLKGIDAGMHFREIQHLGVRLVSMEKGTYERSPIR